jgi:anti-sigma factor RsiW
MTCDEVKPLLNARMDGEMDMAQNATLDLHLAGCQSCARDLEQLYNIRTAIREGMPSYTAPPALRDQVCFALRGAEYLDRTAPRRPWRAWGSAAAVFVLCVLASSLFLVNQYNQRVLVAEEFLSAHQRALIGRELDVVSSDQHTVKPWFNGKLPFSPPVIDLGPEGFPLEGGRLDYVGGNPVAALVYRRRNHRIDVFVQPFAGQKAPPDFERNGFRELSWIKDDFLFTAVSDLNAGELVVFAKLLSGR